MRLEADFKLGFKDVLIRPKRSTLKSRSEVSLVRDYSFLHSGLQWQGVPIVAANMDTVGTFAMAKELSKSKLLTAVHKYYSLEEWKCFTSSHANVATKYCFVSTGSSDADLLRLGRVIELIPEIQFICIDVANGYTQHFVDFVKKVRHKFQEKTIFAGNVVTGEMVEELILAGADAVKVGIGPGSVCTTRVKTGIGYPQLSAVIECADAAHGLGGHVVSDGGCASPGDISKAFGAGADFVMLGGMLAGHTEGGGQMKSRDGQEFMSFYGMSSKAAMDRYAGGVAEYRASEGKLVEVPFRGPVADSLNDILGGLRSACTYVGASTLKELSKRTTFVRVAEQENKVFS